MKQMLFLIILLPVSFLSANAQSPVWKIEGNGTKIYVGGSIHLLREQDYPLPEEFEDAYKNAEILVLETDLNEASNPANVQKIMKAMIYQDERTLKSVLNEEVYLKLDSTCKQYGMNLNQLDKFTPSMVILTLTAQTLGKLGVTSNGVDTYFMNKAITDNKKLLYLETFDEQLGFVESMGKGNENEYVLYSIEDLEVNVDQFTELIESWKKGDLDLMVSQIADYKDDFPELYEKIISGRNATWIINLVQYLETPEIEFVIFGAAHLCGPEGVLQLMKNKGFKVQQL